MKLSVVTGHRDRMERMSRLAQSVIQNTRITWEMVVGDAGLWIGSADPRIRVLGEDPPLGMVRGYNRAFREARGKWVVWVSDDAEVMPYYDKAVGWMEAHPHIGLGCLQWSEKGGSFHVDRYWDMPYANFGILRREIGEAVGWFDEDLEMYASDNSLTCRVLLAGWGVAAVPGCHVMHHRHEDERRVVNELGRMEDQRRFIEKYGPLVPQMQEVYSRCRGVE